MGNAIGSNAQTEPWGWGIGLVDEAGAAGLEGLGAFIPAPWGPLVCAYGHVQLLIARDIPIMQALNSVDPGLSTHLRHVAAELFGRPARSSEVVTFAKGLYAPAQLTADERALLHRLLA